MVNRNSVLTDSIFSSGKLKRGGVFLNIWLFWIDYNRSFAAQM
jgi:hypothetical protein